MKKIAKGLAINGGGCKGLITLYMLDHMHKKMGGEFLRSFDFIGGTSTGGLITGLLAVGKTPKEIIDIYTTHLPMIFEKRFLGLMRGLSKYDNEYLTKLAHNLVGDITLGELTQKIIIPAVNASMSRPKVFRSYDPADAHYKLADVLVATASAPSYFPAYYIEGNWYKDGGLSENNTSHTIRKEALRKPFYFDEVHVLNLTTGRQPERTSKAERKGNLFSIPAMINETLDLQDQMTVKNITDALAFDEEKGRPSGSFTRCEAQISASSGEIDDVSMVNIRAMMEDGHTSTMLNLKKLNDFCLLLSKD